MPVVNGKMYTCERCGRTEFIEDGNVIDSGKMMYANRYAARGGQGILCGICMEKYKNLIHDFWEGENHG